MRRLLAGLALALPLLARGQNVVLYDAASRGSIAVHEVSLLREPLTAVVRWRGLRFRAPIGALRLDLLGGSGVDRVHDTFGGDVAYELRIGRLAGQIGFLFREQGRRSHGALFLGLEIQ
jgi:hypothetical protein